MKAVLNTDDREELSHSRERWLAVSVAGPTGACEGRA